MAKLVVAMVVVVLEVSCHGLDNEIISPVKVNPNPNINNDEFRAMQMTK